MNKHWVLHTRAFHVKPHTKFEIGQKGGIAATYAEGLWIKAVPWKLSFSLFLNSCVKKYLKWNFLKILQNNLPFILHGSQRRSCITRFMRLWTSSFSVNLTSQCNFEINFYPLFPLFSFAFPEAVSPLGSFRCHPWFPGYISIEVDPVSYERRKGEDTWLSDVTSSPDISNTHEAELKD